MATSVERRHDAVLNDVVTTIHFMAGGARDMADVSLLGGRISHLHRSRHQPSVLFVFLGVSTTKYAVDLKPDMVDNRHILDLAPVLGLALRRCLVPSTCYGQHRRQATWRVHLPGRRVGRSDARGPSVITVDRLASGDKGADIQRLGDRR